MNKGGRPAKLETVALRSLCRGVVWVVASHGRECTPTSSNKCKTQALLWKANQYLDIEVATWHTRDGRLCVAKPPLEASRG